MQNSGNDGLSEMWESVSGARWLQGMTDVCGLCEMELRKERGYAQIRR